MPLPRVFYVLHYAFASITAHTTALLPVFLTDTECSIKIERE
ncbi:MAG: anion permease [Candidatus Bathyarchaeia archaeon]